MKYDKWKTWIDLKENNNLNVSVYDMMYILLDTDLIYTQALELFKRMVKLL